jgi:hydroxypyruvate reductase
VERGPASILLREHALSAFQAGVAAADPARAVRAALELRAGRPWIAGQEVPARTRRLRAVAFGKAACAMASAVEEALPPEVFPGPGVAVTVRGGGRPLARFRVLEGGHPIPDEGSVAGAREVARALAGAADDELALALISGGGSALLAAPAPGISLEDKMATTELLLKAGADIRELNTVRKHLSSLKGGGLARAAAPAPLRALILSDVIGNDLSVIASGPVSPDPSTFADAIEVLKRRGVLKNAPAAVLARLSAGLRGEVEETPKPGDALFDRVVCAIVGSNELSIDAARARAEKLGHRTALLAGPLLGEASEAGRVLAAAARRSAAGETPASIALIAGGETTVTVHGPGRGGRNQELALAFALEVGDLPGWTWAFLSAGTDGIDGPTDAAGGLVDGGTLGRLSARGIDPRAALERNDSYAALAASGDLVVTGATGTNVADVQVLLMRRESKESPIPG